MDDTPAETDASANDVAPAERHAARAALYGGIAAAFCYPDEATVADLTHEDTAEGLRSAAAKLGFESAVERLLDALAATERERLESTYNELFGLPSDEGTYPVVPYEAEYTVGDDVGQQQRRIATVIGLLETFGVEPAEGFDERQDHVVVELELMQVLAARRAIAERDGETDAARNLERAEATVLDEHLGDFVPAFAHDLRRTEVGSETEPETGREPANESREIAAGVYRAAADLAEAVVTRDGDDHPESDVDLDADAGVRTRV